jgi:hypothetical protein
MIHSARALPPSRRHASMLLAMPVGLLLQASPPTVPPQAPAPPAAADGSEAPSPPTASPREVAAGDGSGAENRPAEGEITARLEAAVSRGLDHLASQQNPDGSFGRGRNSDNAGIVSLAAIAFMADGHLPGRGRHGETVRRAIDFVLSQASETGLIATEGGHGPMYGHGFATLMLGEAYGMAPDDARVRDTLVRAVELIVNSQNPEGGWRYNPVPYDADVSVTICQVMALRSAREAGIKVPASTIERAIQYVIECQNPDGGFKYMRTAGASGWARTAAGVAALFYAGVYEGESIDRGLDYLLRQAMPGGSSPATQAHYYYGHYYAVQATYLAGGEWWRRWWPAIREDLISQQTASGGWIDPQQGNAYATAMALIVLQMPKRYLPIFQR